MVMETFDMLNVAFGEQTMGITQVFLKWFSEFKSSVTSAEDTDGSGRPSASRTDENLD